MLFNSIDFVIFMPVVFLLYWFVANRNLRLQNSLLLASSYVFYGWWDWRFLGLIIFSSTVDYLVGIGFSRTDDKRRRKFLLLTSVFVNLGLLGFFKYFNFFSDSFAEAFRLFGSSFEPARLNLILPIGISFYTFQTLSYTIDIYRKKIEPTSDILSFYAFVSFFPQLVAGPIERATTLLPQFFKKRTFDSARAADGLRQILWGMFKKVVIADNLAVFVNIIFENSTDYSGTTLILGNVFFAFQVYCDFSGYSDIAIGTARLFGFDLMKNFSFPFFSRDIAEFWRRWHISLTTWFRDYLYIPLGGSRGGKMSKVRNVFIIFVVSGFWHGASWKFVFWGALNAIYFLPLLILEKHKVHVGPISKGRIFPTLSELYGMVVTFSLIVYSLIFFRADSFSHAFYYGVSIFTGLVVKASYLQTLQFIDWYDAYTMIVILLAFIVVEWFTRNRDHGLDFTKSKLPKTMRWGIYAGVAMITIFYMAGQMDMNIWMESQDQEGFIYFQF